MTLHVVSAYQSCQCSYENSSPSTWMTCSMSMPYWLGELEVALVVRRHAHHGAVAVAHQDVVADPERDLLVAERMLDDQAGVDAALGLRRDLGLGRSAGLARLEEGGDLGVRLGRAQRQRMLGRDGAERHAHDRVGARREDVEAAAADQRAVGLARMSCRKAKRTPSLLPSQCSCISLTRSGQPGQAGLHALEQLVGVLGDLQVVARDLALLDQCAGAPAAPFDHLLVGEHGLVDRIPVDDLRAPLGDARPRASSGRTTGSSW